MPRRSENGAAATAMAFVTYALVPYLGILFCPGALLFGGVGLVRAWRAPRAGHTRAAALSLVLGLIVLCAQIILWWLLYKVPEWSRQSPF
jgi:predicted small integral membrane protein